METKQHFEYIGHHREYFSNGKYVRHVVLDSPDRDKQGYSGRQYHVATEDITLGKKTIKKGQQYYTECIIICGRTLK